MKKSLGAKTIACPCPVWCIGTYDAGGRPNVMTVAWAGICCSDPPAVTVSLRKATYSYQSIIDSQAFTVSIPSQAHAKEADFFGLASGREVDKFQVAGLTPVRSETVNAPYVAEFPLILECRLIQQHEIGLHTQFVGEIIDVKADEGVLGEDGKADMGLIRPLLFAATNRNYFGTGEHAGAAFRIGKDLLDKARGNPG